MAGKMQVSQHMTTETMTIMFADIEGFSTGPPPPGGLGAGLPLVFRALLCARWSGAPRQVVPPLSSIFNRSVGLRSRVEVPTNQEPRIRRFGLPIARSTP